MTLAKPTALFVHGSWHNPNHFRRVRDLFEAQGFPTSCPLHPSVGKLPLIGLKEDAQCIRDEVKRLVEEEEIVIAHSYGGIVATEARKSQGFMVALFTSSSCVIFCYHCSIHWQRLWEEKNFLHLFLSM
jgi:hypothetical protein